MSRTIGLPFRTVLVVVILTASGARNYSQADDAQMAPINDAPNPYRTIADWMKLPD
jgi:hypothetical protein